MLIEMQRRERNALIMSACSGKGRERWEVHERLRELDAKVAPLKLRLKQLQEDREKVIEEHEAKKVKLDELSDDTDKLEKEVKMMLTMRNKYWDSSRISGAPQRFLTKYLQVRLAEQLEEQQASVAEMKDQYDEMLVHERELDRQIRQVRRELRPLTEGMVDFVMKARTRRLRDRVRKEAWAATKLQACYRGMRYRSGGVRPERRAGSKASTTRAASSTGSIVVAGDQVDEAALLVVRARAAAGQLDARRRRRTGPSRSTPSRATRTTSTAARASTAGRSRPTSTARARRSTARCGWRRRTAAC